MGTTALTSGAEDFLLTGIEQRAVALDRRGEDRSFELHGGSVP